MGNWDYKTRISRSSGILLITGDGAHLFSGPTFFSYEILQP